MKRLKVVGVRKLSSLEYLKAYRIDYLDAKGKERSWELASRGSLDRLKEEIYDHKSISDGTMIFALNREKTHVALIKEFRVSAGRYVYTTPAGLQDEGESLAETAKREFFEETGLTLEPKVIDRERYTSVGLSNEKVTIVYGYYDGSPSQDHLTDSEDIEVIFVDRDKAQYLLEHEEVTIRTAILLQQFFKLLPVF